MGNTKTKTQEEQNMIGKLYKYTGNISSFSYRRNSPEAVPVVDMILGDINDDDKAPHPHFRRWRPCRLHQRHRMD